MEARTCRTARHERPRTGFPIVFLAALLPFLLLAPGAAALDAPSDLRVADTPNDNGSGLTLAWTLPPEAAGAAIVVLRAEGAGGAFVEAARLEPGAAGFVDRGLSRESSYRYQLRLETAEAQATSAPTAALSPRLNLFNRDRVNALVILVVFCALVMSFITSARSGRELFIRKIAGLNALDEAIGRATEMGRKILYIPGIMSLDEIQTVASLAVLKYVAKMTARFQADLEVPNKDPITFVAARETVKEAYLEQGRPDLYRDEMVNYVTYDQFAFTATISGKMVRERPAANLLIGSFYAESLLLAEAGQSVGAIQIAGTAEVAQLPFFVCACDYTLIGEELYAASAYLSRDPATLGSIKGQDYTKLLVIGAILLGIVLQSAGVTSFQSWFTAR